MRPGVNIQSRAEPPPEGAPTDTGVLFAGIVSEKGPTDAPVSVSSITDYGRFFGSRADNPVAYDSLEAAFREGLAKAVLSRAAGPAAVAAFVVLVDRAGAPIDTLRVEARGPGAYANDFTVQVIDGVAADTFVLIIFEDGVEIDRSYELGSPTEAVDWGSRSEHVRVVDLASGTAAPANNPAVVAQTPMAGGTDDRAAITDVHREAAIDRIPKTMGPGQVAYFGATTAAMHGALIEHAEATNRFALCDGPDSAASAAMIAAADGARAAKGTEEFGAIFGPHIVIPGGNAAPGTRKIPPSGFVAGVIARNDRTVPVNQPSAGRYGRARFAIGVTRTYTDAERQAMNEAGMNIIKPFFGGTRIYGYRTLADADTAPGWLSMAAARLRMQMSNEFEITGEDFAFLMIDGRRRAITRFANALSAICLRHYNAGELFGETPEEAYFVDTSVNTVETIANGELRAVVTLKIAPYGEEVTIEIVKVALNQAVA